MATPKNAPRPTGGRNTGTKIVVGGAKVSQHGKTSTYSPKGRK